MTTLSARFSRASDTSGAAVALAPALAAGLLWLLAALVTTYWLLHLWGRAPLTPVAAMAGNPVQVDTASLARALGEVPQAPAIAPVAPPASSRFRLLGLVGQPGQRGAALIAVDGQPPRPVLVGSVVEGDLLLLSVRHSGVLVGAKRGDAAAFELNLPEVKE